MRSPPGTRRYFNSPEIWPTSNQSFNSALSWLPPHLTKTHHPHSLLPHIALTETFFPIEPGGSRAWEQVWKQKMWPEIHFSRAHQIARSECIPMSVFNYCLFILKRREVDDCKSNPEHVVPMDDLLKLQGFNTNNCSFCGMTHCFNAAVFNITIIEMILCSSL